MRAGGKRARPRPGFPRIRATRVCGCPLDVATAHTPAPSPLSLSLSLHHGSPSWASITTLIDFCDDGKWREGRWRRERGAERHAASEREPDPLTRSPALTPGWCGAAAAGLPDCRAPRAAPPHPPHTLPSDRPGPGRSPRTPGEAAEPPRPVGPQARTPPHPLRPRTPSPATTAPGGAGRERFLGSLAVSCGARSPSPSPPPLPPRPHSPR